MQAKVIFQARWIAPMDQPIIRDGAVVVCAGRIAAVGTQIEIHRNHPDGPFEDLGEVLLLPGLVNPHVHLELSDCNAGDSAGGTFAEWILSIRERMQLRDRAIESAAETAVRNGVDQCIRFGVTTVGDVTSHIEASRAVLRDSPLRCVSFGEVLGLARQRERAEQALPRAIDRTFASPRLRIGLSPHAPYTVDLEMYERCVETARQHDLPVATHLAESADEEQFLRDHAGSFRDVWNAIGQWEEPLRTFPGSPIEMAEALGMLESGALLAHVNYCDDDEMNLLACGRSSVIYCPRTHRYFGHAPHRWRDMLARGINVAAGTDSCASSPNLNLLDDLRLLRELAPQMPSRSILELGTTRAARALDMHDEVGSISPGKFADFAALEATGDDPLESLLRGDQEPIGVWIGGAAISLPPAASRRAVESP